jgi:ParB family transcriptional regulator, chromosome partitioning protein
MPERKSSRKSEAKPAAKAAGRGRAPAKTATRKSRKPQAPRGPEPRASVLDPSSDDISTLKAQVEQSGGAVLGAYRDPYAGSPLLLASVPLKRVEPTPFQRDLSKTHADRLIDAIGAAGLFLDPVIAAPGDGGFWTPNGRHRLEAARRLGMRAITILLVPDERIAYRILVLNTEKAHNLRDRSLEVIRMARQLARDEPRSKESDHVVSFESPIFLTLGCVYAQRTRFAGSAYQPMLRRIDRFLDQALPAALRQRDQWAVRLMDIEDRVAGHIKMLQEHGFKSPYLRQLVVARCNPVRFVPPTRKKDAAPPMSIAEALTKMAVNVRKFDPSKVRPQDLALVAAIAPAGEE